MIARRLLSGLVGLALLVETATAASDYTVTENDKQIRISTPQLDAAVAKHGYVSGVAAQSLLDKKTGFRDPGFGLDIVDWIMEPSKPSDRDDPFYGKDYRIDGQYRIYHGSRRKRKIEGPQICTQAKRLDPVVIRGKDFVAVKQQYRYRTAGPGRKPGSLWTQILLFPVGKRYFLSMDRIDAVNQSDAMFLRIDMPGHLKHNRGDSFSKIYLSYHGMIPPSQFLKDFPPDEKFNYRRDQNPIPKRFIRAYQLRDPKTARDGPWLAGMTLDPAIVHEAWCHQRDYICFIEEFGGHRVKAGESFSAAFVVGYFDSVEEMNRVYDQYKGHTALEVTSQGWKLGK